MQTLRPANVVTSMADGVAGWAVYQNVDSTTSVNYAQLPVLLLCHALLYAGGIMANDVLDAEKDSRFRPERPIPRGALDRKQVLLVAGGIQVLAVIIAASLSWLSALWAMGIIAATYLYNIEAKKSFWFGPAIMGLCRALNFLLPLTLDPQSLTYGLPIAMLPLIYIYGITLSSRYEEEGGSSRPQLAALVLYGGVLVAMLDLSTQRDLNWIAIAFIAGFAAWLLPAAVKAWQQPSPIHIRHAVRTGVLGVVLYDACITSIYWHPLASVAVACLLPLCIWLGKKFSVT